MVVRRTRVIVRGIALLACKLWMERGKKKESGVKGSQEVEESGFGNQTTEIEQKVTKITKARRWFEIHSRNERENRSNTAVGI